MGERSFVAALFSALGFAGIALGSLSSGAGPSPLTLGGGAMLAVALAILGSHRERRGARNSAIVGVGPYRTMSR